MVTATHSPLSVAPSLEPVCESGAPVHDGPPTRCKGCGRVLCNECYYSGAPAHGPYCPMGEEAPDA